MTDTLLETARRKNDNIERRLQQLLEVTEKRREILSLPDSDIVVGVEQWYSVSEAARFFSRTPAWLYEGLKKGRFTYADGSPIHPRMVGGGPKPRRRFNLPLIQEIAFSMHRDGTLKMLELRQVMRRIAMAELSEVIAEDEDVS